MIAIERALAPERDPFARTASASLSLSPGCRLVSIWLVLAKTTAAVPQAVVRAERGTAGLSKHRTLRRYLLSQHPEVEAKLAAELDAAGLLVTPERPNPRPMEFGDLAALTYLSWVCKVHLCWIP